MGSLCLRHSRFYLVETEYYERPAGGSNCIRGQERKIYNTHLNAAAAQYSNASLEAKPIRWARRVKPLCLFPFLNSSRNALPRPSSTDALSRTDLPFDTRPRLYLRPRGQGPFRRLQPERLSARPVRPIIPIEDMHVRAADCAFTDADQDFAKADPWLFNSLQPDTAFWFGFDQRLHPASLVEINPSSRPA